MHKKRKLKGFTLVELIIVIAIFAIIMTLVMSLIDPVAKIMNKTSIRERTAAYADNISEYIDNSLHYSEYMRVFNGGFCEPDFDTSDGDDKTTNPVTEEAAVKDFVYQMLGGAVAPDPQNEENIIPIRGRVRVMKLINTNDGALLPGRIYESVYGFTTADEITDASGVIIDSDADTQISLITDNQSVINEEHYEDAGYNYYFKTGFYTLDPISDPENFSDSEGDPKSYAATSREYYKRLNQILYSKDPDNVVDDPVEMSYGRNFSVNIVSYQDGNREDATYKISDDSSEVIPVFKSPAHLNAATMALTNIINSGAEFDEQGNDKIRYVRQEYGLDDEGNLDTSEVLYNGALNKNLKFDTYSEFTAKDSAVIAEDNIYIIYILPDEIFDTNIAYD